MLLGTVASAEVQTQEQQKAEGKWQIEFEHYSKSHVCVLVSDVPVKINHDSTVPHNSSDSPQHKYRGEGRRRRRRRGCKYIPGMFFFFFFSSRGKNRRKRESRHSSELNAFFKVELNFVQNPPGGRHY